MKITLAMVQTADGIIACDSAHSPMGWTSPEDKAFFKQLSEQAGVVIMGEKTFDTFKKPLPRRLNVVFSMRERAPHEGVRWVGGDPTVVVRALEAEGFKEAILAGGATLNSLFLEHKLIDEMIVTVEPHLFGSGLTIFNRPADIALERLSLESLNDHTYYVRYKVIYPQL